MAVKKAHKMYRYNPVTQEFLPFFNNYAYLGHSLGPEDRHKLNEFRTYGDKPRGNKDIKRGFSVLGIGIAKQEPYMFDAYKDLLDSIRYLVEVEEKENEAKYDKPSVNEDYIDEEDVDEGMKGSIGKLMQVSVPAEKVIPNISIPDGYDKHRDSPSEYQVTELMPVKEEKLYEYKVLPKGYVGQEIDREWFKKFRDKGWTPEDILEYMVKVKTSNKRKRLFRLVQKLRNKATRLIVDEQFKNPDDNVSDERLKDINENI
jgi:hypothetical protein